MAKQVEELEVNLRNDWFNGGRLLRTVDNPHRIPKSRLDDIPSSAKVKDGDEYVSIDEYRGGEKPDSTKAAEDKAAAEKKAQEDAKAKADADAKKAADNKLKL